MNTIILNGNEALKKIAEAPQLSHVVKAPFSEKDILYLQDAFTSSGVHSITVDSIKKGRELILQLLTSLDWYQDIAYLSVSDVTPCIKAANILTKIEQPLTHETIAQFFIDEFYYDFLWIEVNENLFSEQWLAAFESQLINFHIDQMIPVIIVLYS